MVYFDEDFSSYHDLSQMAPSYLHAVEKYNSKNGDHRNEISVLNSGLVALQARIDMIRSAKKTINVEYFIYSPDMAGKIITRELVAASKRGVEVRMLIDKSATVFKFDEYYAAALKKYGIDVRYYNAAPWWNVSTINFRDHRKLLIVDDSQAITGGRNIEDDYFDLSTSYNFLDRDLYVKGTIVHTMTSSFNAFFENPIAEKPNPIPEPKILKALNAYKVRNQQVLQFLSESKDEINLRKKIRQIARPILNNKQKYLCPETTFTSDAPGGSFITRLIHPYSDDYRFLRKSIFDKIMKVDGEVVISSPYLLENKKENYVLDSLLRKGVGVTLYSNSLSSTDATYVAAQMYAKVDKWKNLGLKVYEHSGQWYGETAVIEPIIKSARWGTHSKTHIYLNKDGSSEIMVGTFNVDNRSSHYNSENGLFCKGNSELTKEVLSSVRSRMYAGYELLSSSKAIDSSGRSVNPYGYGDPKVIEMKLMYVPSSLFEFLL